MILDKVGKRVRRQSKTLVTPSDTYRLQTSRMWKSNIFGSCLLVPTSRLPRRHQHKGLPSIKKIWPPPMFSFSCDQAALLGGEKAQRERERDIYIICVFSSHFPITIAIVFPIIQGFPIPHDNPIFQTTSHPNRAGGQRPSQKTS